MTTQFDNQCRRVIVLDTSAFLAGYDPFAHIEEQVTVPKVEEEILRNSMIKMRFETAIESDKVKVKAPTKEFSDSAKASASKVGDSFKLSEADMQVLALAIEVKAEGYSPQIVTDDYSIQNVATQMGIDFLPLATFGIKRLLEWVRYCPACHRQYPTNCKTKECQVCGTELKRKPRRNKPKNRLEK
jgi:endoribonuclease Nob1